MMRNPLDRRMFMNPQQRRGMARMPQGILASGPRIMQAAAEQEPVRMSHGGYHGPATGLGMAGFTDFLNEYVLGPNNQIGGLIVHGRIRWCSGSCTGSRHRKLVKHCWPPVVSTVPPQNSQAPRGTAGRRRGRQHGHCRAGCLLTEDITDALPSDIVESRLQGRRRAAGRR